MFLYHMWNTYRHILVLRENEDDLDHVWWREYDKKDIIPISEEICEKSYQEKSFWPCHVDEAKVALLLMGVYDAQ